MKLLRLKITDPKGFRSLQAGFEHHFRTDWDLQEEQGFAPFVCAGPNGSGKSNLLEALAAIFFQLEVLRVRRSFLPDNFLYDEETNRNGFKETDASPDGFELEYLIRVPVELQKPDSPSLACVSVIKGQGQVIEILWLNQAEFDSDTSGFVTERERDFLLPEYVLGYSSGENEILSLPFFKMRFIQLDEYWFKLSKQLDYFGRPETRLAYLDNSFSQAILLCNLLFQDDETLQPFREDVGLKDLKEFRIILKRSVSIEEEDIFTFGSGDESKHETIESIVWGEDGNGGHPALFVGETEGGIDHYRIKLLELLFGKDKSDKIINRLIRCATCTFEDEKTDSLYLDYYVNEATKQAFRENFSNSAIELFQALQVLLTLNLYSVSDTLKTELYQSNSLYVSETVPVLASDERIMRIKNFWFEKEGVAEPVLLKSLSDGEHQLLHSLGLCLLFKNTNSLFLLDEPETHFNPSWRSNFISRLHQCFKGSEDSHEMLITTHTPFLISDSQPEKVLVFKKENNQVSISKPDYNTLGASINKITMNTFDKRETIGGFAQSILEEFRNRSQINDEDKDQLIDEINKKLGDSVEKVLLIKTILDSMEEKG